MFFSKIKYIQYIIIRSCLNEKVKYEEHENENENENDDDDDNDEDEKMRR